MTTPRFTAAMNSSNLVPTPHLMCTLAQWRSTVLGLMPPMATPTSSLLGSGLRQASTTYKRSCSVSGSPNLGTLGLDTEGETNDRPRPRPYPVKGNFQRVQQRLKSPLTYPARPALAFGFLPFAPQAHGPTPGLKAHRSSGWWAFGFSGRLTQRSHSVWPIKPIDYIIGGRMTDFPSCTMRTPDNTDVYEPIEAPAEAPAPTLADEQERDTTRVPGSVVQREWDQTLKRISELCEVQDGTTQVSERQYAHLLINKTEGLDIEQVEAILFENLLFSPWARVEHARSFILSGEWLWKWRRKAAWKADPVGHMIRLAPDAPKRMWTYRFNVIDA